MKISKYAFIDLDGTLVNSKLRHQQVLRDVLEVYDRGNLDIQDLMDYKEKGFSTRDYLIKILLLEEDVAKKVAIKWGEKIEQEKYLKMDFWYQDALLFLQTLRAKGWKNIVLTARNNVDGVLKFIEKSDHIAYIDDIVVVKAENPVFEKERIIEKYSGIKIIIGDTETEYNVAENLSMQSFILNRGFRNKHFWGNIETYDTLYDIVKLIQ